MKIKKYLSFINENDNFNINQLYKLYNIEMLEEYFLDFLDNRYDLSFDYVFVVNKTNISGKYYEANELLKLGDNTIGYKITIMPSKKSKKDLTDDFKESIRRITSDYDLKATLLGFNEGSYDINNFKFEEGNISYNSSILTDGLNLLLIENEPVSITFEQLADYYNWNNKTSYIDIDFYIFNVVITGDNKYFSEVGKTILYSDNVNGDYEPDIRDFKDMLSRTTLESILQYIIDYYGIDKFINFINVINDETGNKKIDKLSEEDLIDYILNNYDTTDVVLYTLYDHISILEEIQKLIGDITRDKYVNDIYSEYMQKLNERLKDFPKHEIIEKDNIKYYRFYFDNAYLQDHLTYEDINGMSFKELLKDYILDNNITITKIDYVDSYVDEEELEDKIIDFINKKATI